ncbi:MAG: sigma-70 family RNA polymerase sigma factor [Candidatus Aminicenantes bacterium]|nr:sigma-70 family RNA polymerase sigma factor [Candidatus Aminicenantes bacterium]
MTEEQTKLEFAEQIKTNQNILKKISHIYGADEEDRQDLFQEMVGQLWKSYPTFSGKAKFSTWLYRVTLNTALYHVRKTKKQKLTEEVMVDLYNSSRGSDRMIDDLKILYRAIDQLNKIDKAIVLLYLEQKTYQEMAEILGLTRSNVSVKLVRAKEKLIKIYEKTGDH